MCTFHSWKDFRTVAIKVEQLHFIDIKKYKRLKYTDGQQSRGKWNIEFLSASSVLPNIDCPSLVKPRLTSLQQKEVMMLVTAVRTNIVVPSHFVDHRLSLITDKYQIWELCWLHLVFCIQLWSCGIISQKDYKADYFMQKVLKTTLHYHISFCFVQPHLLFILLSMTHYSMLVLKWRMSQLLKFTKWKWSERKDGAAGGASTVNAQVYLLGVFTFSGRKRHGTHMDFTTHGKRRTLNSWSFSFMFFKLLKMIRFSAHHCFSVQK